MAKKIELQKDGSIKEEKVTTQQNNKIRIQKDGQVLEVYEKAFRVVYEGAGYRLADEDEKDIAEMTEEELKSVKNDVLKAYLDELEIEYKTNATKEELINLIVGE